MAEAEGAAPSVSVADDGHARTRPVIPAISPRRRLPTNHPFTTDGAESTTGGADMKGERQCRWSSGVRIAAIGASLWSGCGGDSPTETTTQLVSTSSASVRLQELTNSCGGNQAQDFFKVTNAGTTAIPASDITIKIWVDDTSGSNIVPRIDTGGCLLDGF